VCVCVCVCVSDERYTLGSGWALHPAVLLKLTEWTIERCPRSLTE
jgi:hypothetical protein